MLLTSFHEAWRGESLSLCNGNSFPCSVYWSSSFGQEILRLLKNLWLKILWRWTGLELLTRHLDTCPWSSLAFLGPWYWGELCRLDKVHIHWLHVKILCWVSSLMEVSGILFARHIVSSDNFFGRIIHFVRSPSARKDWALCFIIEIDHVDWDRVLNFEPTSFVIPTFLNWFFRLVNLTFFLLGYFSVVFFMLLYHFVDLCVFDSLICIQNFWTDIRLLGLHRENRNLY